MCHDADSHPPELPTDLRPAPIAGGALETRDLVLTAPDGNRLRAFEARAPSWGSETQIRSRRDAVVLVDEPTEQVPPANIERADRDRDGDRGFSQRRGEAEGAMGPPAVVVLGVGPERPIEMPLTSG